MTRLKYPHTVEYPYNILVEPGSWLELELLCEPEEPDSLFDMEDLYSLFEKEDLDSVFDVCFWSAPYRLAVPRRFCGRVYGYGP